MALLDLLEWVVAASPLRPRYPVFPAVPKVGAQTKIAPMTLRLTDQRLIVVEDHAFGVNTKREDDVDAAAVKKSNELKTGWMYQRVPQGSKGSTTTTTTTELDQPSCCACFTCSCEACTSCKCIDCGMCQVICKERVCCCCEKLTARTSQNSVSTAARFYLQLLYYPIPLGFIDYARFEMDETAAGVELLLSIRYVEPVSHDPSLMILTMTYTDVGVKELMSFLGALSSVCPAMSQQENLRRFKGGPTVENKKEKEDSAL